MKQTYSLNSVSTLAAAYDCSAYGSGSYNQVNSCSTQPANDSKTQDTTAQSNILANTGYDVLLPIIFAITLIVVAVFAIIKKLLK